MRRPSALVRAVVALSALVIGGCAASDGGGRVCANGCATGQSCVVGRCRPVDEAVAPTDTRRVVLAPSDFAAIESSGALSPVAETVVLGRREGGPITLLLRFAAPWGDDADVLSAFVVLDLEATAPPATAPAFFESARILEPWLSSVVSWGRMPRLDVPKLAAIVRAIPGTSLRIDVTALVREWAQRHRDDHGVALVVHGDDALGSAVAMGVTGGTGPRLEAYVR